MIVVWVLLGLLLLLLTFVVAVVVFVRTVATDIMEHLGKNALSWHTYDELVDAVTDKTTVLDLLLELLVEDGYILCKPTDAAITPSSRFVDGKFEKLPEEEQVPELGLSEALSSLSAFSNLPKRMYEFRLNPRRPRRGPKAGAAGRMKDVLVGNPA